MKFIVFPISTRQKSKGVLWRDIHIGTNFEVINSTCFSLAILGSSIFLRDIADCINGCMLSLQLNKPFGSNSTHPKEKKVLSERREKERDKDPIDSASEQS